MSFINKNDFGQLEFMSDNRCNTYWADTVVDYAAGVVCLSKQQIFDGALWKLKI